MTYTQAELTTAAQTYSPLDAAGTYGLVVQTPDQGGNSGDSVDVSPMESHLVARGDTVSGTLVFPAILPGDYTLGDISGGNFDFGSIGIGSMHTSDLGVLGGASLGNALVVFGEHKSTTNTVVVFGIVGDAQADADDRAADICVENQESNFYHPTQISVSQSRKGTSSGTRYEVGTAVFAVPSSSASAVQFGNCFNGQSSLQLQ